MTVRMAVRPEPLGISYRSSQREQSAHTALGFEEVERAIRFRKALKR